MLHVYLMQKLMKLLRESDQNGLKIPGAHSQLNWRAMYFMAKHPGRHKGMDAYPNSLNTISTGAKSRHMCQNCVLLQWYISQVLYVIHYMLRSWVIGIDVPLLTSDKNFVQISRRLSLTSPDDVRSCLTSPDVWGSSTD